MDKLKIISEKNKLFNEHLKDTKIRRHSIENEKVIK